MSETLQEAAISIAQKAFGDHSVEKDIAQYIKKEFDRLVLQRTPVRAALFSDTKATIPLYYLLSRYAVFVLSK